MAERCLSIIQEKPKDVRFGLPNDLAPEHLRGMCKTIVKHARPCSTVCKFSALFARDITSGSAVPLLP
jgi:hypothetical protein